MADNTRFRDLYEVYCQNLVTRGCADVDARSVHRVYLHKLDDLEVRAVRPADIAGFVASLVAAGLSAMYVRKVHAFLRASLSVARTRGLIHDNPAARMEPGAVPGCETRAEFDAAAEILTLAEVLRYIADQQIPLYRRLLVGVLALTGMRLGEALGLIWDDVNMRARPLWRITISKSWSRKENRLKPPKTKRWKTIAAHPLLAALLMAARVDFRERFGRDPLPCDLVVAHPDGKIGEPRYYPDNSALRHFHAHLDDLAIDPARRLHSLRHFFLTTFVDLGASERTIRSMTHPPQRASSADHYLHTTWAAKCRAIALLSAGPQLELFKDKT